MKRLAILLITGLLVSCVTPEIESDRKIHIKSEMARAEQDSKKYSTGQELKVPEFVPVKEEVSPLKSKTVSVSARNTPLRDVLHSIAETANLNIVLESGADPELPLTMTFKDVFLEDALAIIFDSADYFYEVRDNILVVKAMDTRIYELDQLSIKQDYGVEVGGDILSGAASGEGGTAVRGNISMKSTSDSDAYEFWVALQRSIAVLLGIRDAETGGGPSYTINRLTGTIMVTASKKDLKKVGDYIANLKKVLNRQVVVEARIVEVQLSDGLNYGIDWTAVGEWIGAGPMSVSTNSFTDLISTGTPSFEVNIFDNDNLTLLLKALQEQGDVTTLSNPRVNIMNGQTSMLSVGRNTTFISSVETTTTSNGGVSTTTFTVDTSSILSGIMFGIVPFINQDREVTLTITPIITNLVQLESKTIGITGNSVEIKLPTVDLREMSTTVRVLDGQLIIIGGLIDKKENLVQDKIPFLGDIPGLGNLFKSIKKTHENTELVIMLIPRVIS
ncbi:MAG: pilus (MSHA type) biogenesis protein MshL [Nitrospira sp.]|nr:pilus (MSHA type) biogenesis protein MshL [bacterium]MBL7048279.1 pilus (MSHA type) biogenesis protein MshL [Nitrospira sp.]